MAEPKLHEETLFEAALKLRDLDQRRSFFDAACQGNPELRQRLEKLLSAAGEADNFFAAGSSALEVPTAVDVPMIEKPGDHIGRYKLREKIGEGGCGVVYVAEQTEPVRRRVALKVIKLGMDTRNVVARFDAERQALAVMDHPNIAKVFDAGCTDTGRPFFVMELVRGTKITEDRDEKDLSTRQRLELFMKVCQAVQHAHQKGIIHRDLKPSNILVTMHDGVPVPKIIDFGIAKATEGRLTDLTIYTELHQFIGTPAYMSPEQAELSGLDIDTRSDIYSLGVLLYGLLTGKPPFDPKELMAGGLDEMRRTIREKEPPRPSTRLTQELVAADVRRLTPKPQANDASSESDRASLRRLLQLKELIHLLRGDLDWIVMKALEKDRTRRYETASGMASDIQRHLNNEPIQARPPSQIYRLQKLIRRNKLAFAASLAIILAVLSGLTISTWQFVEKSRAYREQTRLRIQAEKAQRNEAELRQRAEAQAYTADMNLVLQAWEEGNLQRAQELLRKHIPEPAAADLRGFEWRYLWSLCQDASSHVFTNFTHPIGSLRFSPDRDFLAVAAGPGITLLDLNTRREITKLRDVDTNDAIHCAVFCPTRTNLLATAGKLGVIKLWDLAARQVTRFGVHPSEVGSIDFSPEGTLLAVASRQMGSIVSVWDTDLQKLLWTTNTPVPPNAVAFAPDGKAIVTGGGGGNGNARVWDARTGRELQPFPELHGGWIHHLTFSPDGRTLATGAADDKLILWDFATRQAKGRPIRSGGTAIEFSPDGHLLAVSGYNGIPVVWDVASQVQIGMLRGHLGPVWNLAFTPDGSGIVSGGLDRTVRLWNTDLTRDENRLKAHQQWVHDVAFSPDGKTLASVDYHQGLTKLWDVQTRRFIADLPGNPGDQMAGAALFSPKGELLVTSSYSGTILLWDALSMTRIGVLSNEFGVSNLSFSPDGQVLAVAVGFVVWPPDGKRTLAFWELTTSTKLNVLAEAAPNALAVRFSDDGRVVAVGYHEGWVRLWDFKNGQKLAEFQKHAGIVPAVAFSPGSELLASGGDENVVIYSVSQRQVLRMLAGHVGGIKSVSFAPDGKTLAVGGNDGTIRLWSLATYQPILTLKKHSGAVTSVAFTKDGNFMASCGADADVRLWPAASLGEARQ